MVTRPILLTILLVPLIAACNAPSDSAANESAKAAGIGQPSACSVLTKADAEKALGHPAERLASDGGPAALDICQFGYQGERIADAGNVSVTIYPVDSGSLQSGVTESGYAIEPIDGVGEKAFWAEGAGLYVETRGKTALYLLGGAKVKDAKQASIALARATINRI